jgi:hypothetical protein
MAHAMPLPAACGVQQLRAQRRYEAARACNNERV